MVCQNVCEDETINLKIGEVKIMRKMSKKVVALFLAVLFLLSVQCPAFAKIADDEVAPCWIVSCNSGGKHQMAPKYGGHLYSGTVGNPGTDYGWAYISQCTLCKEVLWSTYQPFSTKKIGNYYISPFVKETVQSTGTNLYMNNTGSVEYFGGSVLTDSYWQGYEFTTGYY